MSRDRSASEVWEGSATLELFGAPHEEIDALAPVRIGRGYRLTFAYTVDDLETLRELGA
jgi:acetoacetate decarboxylase